tara:strand:- start:1627 stop:1878 length:252 start_codon:yes stop_codon:yes gene_type:complete
MKKRRFLGHVSSILQLKAEATKALDKALEEGHIHGSQQNSGSVFITDAGSALLVNGTDVDGASRTFRLGITGSVAQFVPTGSV